MMSKKLGARELDLSPRTGDARGTSWEWRIGAVRSEIRRNTRWRCVGAWGPLLVLALAAGVVVAGCASSTAPSTVGTAIGTWTGDLASQRPEVAAVAGPSMRVTVVIAQTDGTYHGVASQQSAYSPWNKDNIRVTFDPNQTNAAHFFGSTDTLLVSMSYDRATDRMINVLWRSGDFAGTLARKAIP